MSIGFCMCGRASALRVRIRRPHHTKDVRKISFEYEPLSRGVDSKKKKLVVSFASDHARIQGEGGGGGWKTTKIRDFLAILVWVPWKITKLPSQHSLSGYHRPASETLVGRWWPAFSVIWILCPLPSSSKKLPELTKLSGSGHVNHMKTVDARFAIWKKSWLGDRDGHGVKPLTRHLTHWSDFF